MKLTTRCAIAAVQGCNEALLAKAADAKLLRTNRVRSDTTVVPPAVRGHRPRGGDVRRDHTHLQRRPQRGAGAVPLAFLAAALPRRSCSGAPCCCSPPTSWRGPRLSLAGPPLQECSCSPPCTPPTGAQRRQRAGRRHRGRVTGPPLGSLWQAVLAHGYYDLAAFVLS